MEGLCLLPGTTDSVTRKRSKIIALLILGLLVLSAVGTCSYFAYKVFMSEEAVTNINGQSMQICAQSDQTTAVLPESSTTTMPVSSSVRTSRRPPKTASISAFGTSKVPAFHTPTHTFTLGSRETTIGFSVQTGKTSSIPYGQPLSSTIMFSLTNPDAEETTMPSSSGEETKQSTEHASTSYLTSNQTQSSSMLTTITETPPTTSEINTDPCKSLTLDMCNNVTTFKYCECKDDGLWIVIQKRFDGSVDFYRDWADYKAGFGDVNGEYWLGNDAIHQMTSTSNYTLKITLTGWDNITKYARYETFSLADEADGYRLSVSGHSGTAQDSLNTHNGYMFTTKDRDNDEFQTLNLAEYVSGAWWFGSQIACSLNGRYLLESSTDEYGIMWSGYGKGPYYSVKETKMLIKPIK